VILVGVVVGPNLLTRAWSAGDAPIGSWTAWLESPGGRLPFELVVESAGARLAARIHIGEEIRVPQVAYTSEEGLLLEFVHYDSRIRAVWDHERDRLDGEWARRSGPEKWSRLEFHAQRARGGRTPWSGDGQPRTGQPDSGAPKQTSAVSGRWSVVFSKTDDPAVGVFEEDEVGGVHGTFLTTTGDYRFLEGRLEDGTLRLAAFDGAHAFLFVAQVQPDGTLKGDFWSRDTWHETWTAQRDPSAQLRDAFQLTRLREDIKLADLAFPDPGGTQRALTAPMFHGKARIIELFGTWCPNCYDATRYLIELQERYGARGLSILALAFEMTGDFDRDAAQVQRYVDHHSVPYPILVAGLSDKSKASKAFPLIDRVRAFPTMLFVDALGGVRAIYTGFSGPATGPAYDRMRQQIESLLDELLTES
jgi:thiol-disulfide isomerase/thioredoxin